MVICFYQMWIIRRVVLFTICTTDSTTSGIYVHWPVTTMIIGATTATLTYLKILCVISILCHLCLEIARIPPRNNSNDASPVFHLFSLARAAQTQEFAFCGSHLLPQEFGVVLRAISWDTWQKPDKDPFLMSSF